MAFSLVKNDSRVKQIFGTWEIEPEHYARIPETIAADWTRAVPQLIQIGEDAETRLFERTEHLPFNRRYSGR